ncbi:MAG: excinuclease ABC subunit UvrC [Ignavibacterium sp.]
MNESLNSKLNNLPDSPGIYQFINTQGKIIYVGKAKNLKSRVKSYFNNSQTSPKTLALVNKISDIDLILTDNELEALVLENNLIKELKPRYNINLKDDKSYPYIKITNEIFPRIYPTRKVVRDGSKYFGPYTEVKSMKTALRMINQIFKIRSCKLNITQEAIEKKKFKVCLDYHIKKCDGPCEGLISIKEYNEMVNQVVKLLRGKTEELIDELSNRMNTYVEGLEYEKAAEIRDRISQLKSISEKQKVVSDDFEDKDIIAISKEDKDASCTIFNIRNGKLINKKQLQLSIEGDENLEEIYSSVIKQFYNNEEIEIPSEIVLEVEPIDYELIEKWLNDKPEAYKRKVKIIVPKRESKLKSLLKMCKENSALQLKEIQLQKAKKEGMVAYSVAALQRDLRLKNPPRKIECFDISNLQGTDSVASMVVFEDGKPKKSLYRKFIIKSVDGPNDFASMREVIFRRYSKLNETNETLPDLIMVDGGKGQLSSAVEILDKLGFKNYNIIGLAKRLEEVYIPEMSEPLNIPKTSSGLKLLQQVRDESHRFAITFHRLRRAKRTFSTELTSIKGIGTKLANKLLKELGSIDEIKNSDELKLSEIIGPQKAKLIKEFFNKK